VKKKNVWKVTTSNQFYPYGNGLWLELLADSCIAIGWNQLGDFDQYIGNQAALEAAYAEVAEFRPGGIGQILTFRDRMEIDDIVIGTEGLFQVNGVGKIRSRYMGENNLDNPRHNHPHGWRNIRMVDWIWPRNDGNPRNGSGISVDEQYRFAIRTVTHAGVEIVNSYGQLRGNPRHRARFEQILERTGLTLHDLV
jgi:hypothetical protein